MVAVKLMGRRRPLAVWARLWQTGPMFSWCRIAKDASLLSVASGCPNVDDPGPVVALGVDLDRDDEIGMHVQRRHLGARPGRYNETASRLRLNSRAGVFAGISWLFSPGQFRRKMPEQGHKTSPEGQAPLPVDRHGLSGPVGPAVLVQPGRMSRPRS